MFDDFANAMCAWYVLCRRRDAMHQVRRRGIMFVDGTDAVLAGHILLGCCQRLF